MLLLAVAIGELRKRTRKRERTRESRYFPEIALHHNGCLFKECVSDEDES